MQLQNLTYYYTFLKSTRFIESENYPFWVIHTVNISIILVFKILIFDF